MKNIIVITGASSGFGARVLAVPGRKTAHPASPPNPCGGIATCDSRQDVGNGGRIGKIHLLSSVDIKF